MRVVKASRRGMGGRLASAKRKSPKQIVCADRTRRFTPDQLGEEITEPRIWSLLEECDLRPRDGASRRAAGARLTPTEMAINSRSPAADAPLEARGAVTPRSLLGTPPKAN